MNLPVARMFYYGTLYSYLSISDAFDDDDDDADDHDHDEDEPDV